MIIDTHCHLFKQDYYHELMMYFEAYFTGKSMGAIVGKEIPRDKVLKTIVPKWYDPTGEATIGRMNEAGIDWAVLLGLDLGYFWGEGEKSVEQQHEEIAKICQQYPGRFLFCPQIDPQRPNGLQLIEKCVTEWGAGAVKLYPITGFAPDDDLVYPLLEKMANVWKIPLIVHIGWEPPPVKAEGAHPRHLERALRDFPNLTILACHLGLIWWRELIALARKYPNLVTDFSGWEPTIVGSYGRFCHVLRRFCDEVGVDRVLFGTDMPSFNHLLPSHEWVQMIKNLPRNAPPESKFTDEEIEAMLGKNAERIFERVSPRRKLRN